MEVSGLFVYPVKSLRGIAVERSAVGVRGLKYDRHWMVIDENGRFRTQRQLPQMALISTALSKDGVVLSAEGCGRVVVPYQARGETVEATVWKWTGPATRVEPRVDTWLSEVLQMNCRLVEMPPTSRRPTMDGEIDFQDGMPILIAGEASLADLNSKLDEPVPMDRFRANVIVRGSEPFAEDGWPGMHIGEVSFVFGRRCGRCLVTTTDQRTGVRHPGEEPLRTLARDRKLDGMACFGAYFAPQENGEIAVGDEVKVLLSDG